MSVIVSIVLVWAGRFEAGTVFAEDPAACTSGCEAAAGGGSGTGSTGTESGGAAGGSAGATTGSEAASSAAGGGSGAASGGGSGASTGSGAAAPAGGGSTGASTGAAAGSTAGTGTGSTSGTGTGSASGTGTGSTTGTQASSAASSGTGATAPAPTGGSTTTNSLTSANGTGSGSAGSGGEASSSGPAAPASAASGSGSGGSTTGGVNASTGDATAVGNYSETVIQQLVFLFANIEMPGVNASDLTGPLISITQNANVTNSGTATATSGSSNALINFITSLGGVSAVSAHAGASSGDATAVGNMSYTDILQVASVMVTLNGNSSVSDQLLSIIQNAGVTNSGSATATSGNSNAAINMGGGGAGGSGSDDDSSSSSNDDEDFKKVYNKQLMWGEAPAKSVVVLLYVDGRQCKQAETEADPERPGSYVWYAYVSLNECGAKPGSQISYGIALPSKQVTKWDNTRRESPEIRLKELMAIKSVYLEK